VRVEQPRHQGPPLAIDDLGAFGTRGPVPPADTADPTFVDHDAGVGLGVAAGAIEQRRVFENEAHGRISLRGDVRQKQIRGVGEQEAGK
jgi:hypothetical protein